MGPSGSGKSTLLNILATIDKESSGEVLIDGISTNGLDDEELSTFRRKNIGVVFQDFNLLDNLTIEENIMLPLILENLGQEEMEHRVKSIADTLGISNILKKGSYEVSGGEQQRTACARALINNPRIVLADEPTGNLDSKSSLSLMNLLERLNKESGRTIVMVTHDAFTASFCNRIIMIKDGQYYLEIVKDSTRQLFFKEIVDSLSLLGGA